MQEWNLHASDPLSLIIGTDARITPPDYIDDQIWELSIGDGEPQALSLGTTYGLRARSIRIFPRFTLDEISVTNPSDFKKPPIIKSIYPNFIELEFSPFSYIDVIAEYWVPESKAITGRIKIKNDYTSPVEINLEWIGILNPNNGERFSAQILQSAHVLSGKTGDLTPLIFLTNGPIEGSGSFPSMALNIHIPPKETHKSTWVHTALSNKEASFSFARTVAARNWEAEKANIELLNQGSVEITTGNPDWDVVFKLSQNLCYRLFFRSSKYLPYNSFVFNRLPDQGYSLRGDGSDYDHQWNGQTPLDLYFLTDILLPASPDLVEGALLNFLAVQEENGFIDWKPGIAGQRSHLLATPILATIAWRIFQYTQDKELLEDNFSKFLKFLDFWFSPHKDLDRDGIPEWDHLLQTGYEDHPIYSQWHETSQGIDIKTSESPALCAFLHMECQTLIKIAQIIEQIEVIPFLEAKIQNLENAIDESWNEELSIYLDRDRDTHLSNVGELVGQRVGSGIIFTNKIFENPIRLLIMIIAEDTTSLQPSIYIHGKSSTGKHRIEKLDHDSFKWHLGIGRLTGELQYSTIEQIEIKDLNSKDQVNVYSAGYNCVYQSLFLPLWAGIPDSIKANQMIEQNLINPDRFWKINGWPACIQDQHNNEDSECNQVNMLWNYLLGEGLIQYGRYQTAAEIVAKLMRAIIKNLKHENVFRRYYHSEKEVGTGERDALSGVIPIGLFLKSLGIQIYSNNKVFIKGTNPYPWPVTLRYRGLSILRQKERTTITFPDSQEVLISDPTPQIITMGDKYI